MTQELSFMRTDMDLLCLMGLTLTIIIVFANLTSCIMGSFRAASPTYQKEVDKLKQDILKGLPEDLLNAKNVMPIRGLLRQQIKQMEKNGSQIDSAGNFVIDPAILTPIHMQIGMLEDRVDPNLKYKTQKKRIPQSSKMYNSTYFQAKNKIAPARPGDVSRALAELQDKNLRVKINEIDERKIDKFRDMGLLSEFNKPLRNYVIDDNMSAATNPRKKK